ncbi:MAG: DUF1698 domain-containing protein, partial [Ostreibacterium sp.]
MNNLINFDKLHHFFTRHHLNTLETDIIKACKNKLNKTHGDIIRWQTVLHNLPTIENPQISINDTQITLSGQCYIPSSEIKTELKQLCQWRKVPFQFPNITIHSEGNSIQKC